MWDRNVGDLFNDALGDAFLWNQLGHLSDFLPKLQNWHNNILLQCVRNLIRARDTVLVTSESNLSGDIFTSSNIAQECENLGHHHLLHSLTIKLRDFLVVIFARDDPTRLVLHGTTDVDRTLLLPSSFFTSS